MPWQLLTLISIAALSSSVLMQRVLLHGRKTDPIAYAMVFQTLTGVILTSYALIQGFVLPDISRYWFPMSVAIVFYAIGHVVYAHTIRHVEASIFSVFFSTSAVWVMLGGVIFLDEGLSLQQVIGSVLVFGSILLLIDKPKNIARDKTVFRGVLIGVIFGIASTAWAYVGQEGDAASWTSMTFLIPGLLVFATNPTRLPKFRSQFNKEIVARLALLATIFGTGAVALQLAYQKGNVSVVSPLWQTNVVLTTVLAIILLHERQRLWYKISAAGICVIGAGLLVV